MTLTSENGHNIVVATDDLGRKGERGRRVTGERGRGKGGGERGKGEGEREKGGIAPPPICNQLSVLTFAMTTLTKHVHLI